MKDFPPLPDLSKPPRPSVVEPPQKTEPELIELGELRADGKMQTIVVLDTHALDEAWKSPQRAQGPWAVDIYCPNAERAEYLAHLNNADRTNKCISQLGDGTWRITLPDGVQAHRRKAFVEERCRQEAYEDVRVIHHPLNASAEQARDLTRHAGAGLQHLHPSFLGLRVRPDQKVKALGVLRDGEVVELRLQVVAR